MANVRNIFQRLHTRFLIILVFIGIIPFTIVGVLLIRQESRALEEQASRELIGLARGLSVELNNQLKELLHDSKAIARLPDIVSMDPARLEPILRLMYIHYYTYGQLAVADLEGQLIATGRKMDLISIEHVPSFQTAAMGHQSWVVFPALLNDNLVLHVHTPIFNDDQQLVGVLGSPVAFPSLADPLESMSIGSGRAYVLDENGHVIIHPDPTIAGENQDLSHLFGFPSGGVPLGSGTTSYTVDGARWIAGYASVPGFGWTIVTERPASEVLSPAIRSGNLAIGGLAGIVCLCLVLAYSMSRSLTLPVHKLAVAASALGHGRPHVPIYDSSNQSIEIATLIRSFNFMRACVIEREQSLRLFHSAMAASIDGMAIIRDSRFIYVNQALMDLYGVTHTAQILGTDWLAVFDRKERMRIADETRAVNAERDVWRGEVTLRAGETSETFLDISLTQLSNSESILVVRDIAERKQTEEALIQAQKMKSLGLLAGGIAHDFNNLIAAILGQSYVAQKKIDPANPAHIHIGRIIRSGERAADLTRQLLAYAGKGRFLVNEFNINELILENVEILETAIQSNIQLFLDLVNEPIGIRADKGQIQQVVMNLVINAAEAIGEQDGVIRIRTSRFSIWDEPSYPTDTVSVSHNFTEIDLDHGKFIALEIYDTGSGMDRETIDKIFDPFYSTKVSGSGLGLSATLGIMQSLKGSIRVSSLRNMGSMFRLIFPESELPDQLEASPLVKQNGSLNGTALIVDDEPSMREAMQDVLESCGMNVLVASNGKQAIELFENHGQNISLTLLDLRMPVMNGVDTLRTIKTLDSRAKVILMSGYTESEDAGTMLDDDTVFFLQKPYSYDKLIQQVESLTKT